MITDECKKTKAIAYLRIHVERAVPVIMQLHIDDIVVTCAALSNLKPN